jgi:RNA polymerase sigma factor (sigma-70 family)
MISEDIIFSEVMMARSDWELIQACRRGDEQAWNRVVSNYQRLVFSIPLNYGLNQNDAADIVQLTFVMLIQSLDTLHKDSHLGGWLATVARRNTWHLLNRRHREQVADGVFDEHENLADEMDEREKEHWELINWLHDGLAQLDKTCRDLLTALYFDPEQPSYKEVAARLHLAEGSIGPMRARCLRRLREIMRNR